MKRGEGHARSNRSDGWDWAALVVAGTEEGGGGGEGGGRRQDQKADTKFLHIVDLGIARRTCSSPSLGGSDYF